MKLPETPLTALPDVRLHRIGDRFALSGYDARSGRVRFAHLSTAGELGAETTLVLPAPALAPTFAPVGKAAPGDQLLIVYGEAAGSQLAMRVQVLAAAPGQPDPAPKPLTDGKGGAVVLDPGADRSALQVALGGAASGMSAAFAWGRGDRSSAPELVILKADGAAEPPYQPLTPAEARWDCLAITRARVELGVSWVGRGGGRPTWHLADLRGDTSTAFSLDVEMPTEEAGCPAVAPTRHRLFDRLAEPRRHLLQPCRHHP